MRKRGAGVVGYPPARRKTLITTSSKLPNPAGNPNVNHDIPELDGKV